MVNLAARYTNKDIDNAKKSNSTLRVIHKIMLAHEQIRLTLLSLGTYFQSQIYKNNPKVNRV